MSAMLPERRGLIAVLAGVEGVLLLAAGLMVFFFAPQPVTGPGGIPCGMQPGGPYGPSGPLKSCPPQSSDSTLLIVAAACALVAVLVLPAVIGWLSVRWQTALSAPSIPIWILVVVAAVISLFNANNDLMGGLSSSGISGFTGMVSIILSVALASQMIGLLVTAVGLGGLAWLARRAFSR